MFLVASPVESSLDTHLNMNLDGPTETLCGEGEFSSDGRGPIARSSSAQLGGSTDLATQ